MSDMYNIVDETCLKLLLWKSLQVPGTYFVLLEKHMFFLHFDIAGVTGVFLLCYRMDRNYSDICIPHTNQYIYNSAYTRSS